MTKNEATDCIRELARYGYVITSSHCRKRMKKRNVIIDDIMRVLFWGEVIKVTYNKPHCNYECKIVGSDIDGEELSFIAAIHEDCGSVKCITVY